MTLLWIITNLFTTDVYKRQGCNQLVGRHRLILFYFVQDVLFPEQQHADLVGSQFGAVPGGILYDLFFFLLSLIHI